VLFNKQIFYTVDVHTRDARIAGFVGEESGAVLIDVGNTST